MKHRGETDGIRRGWLRRRKFRLNSSGPFEEQAATTRTQGDVSQYNSYRYILSIDILGSKYKESKIFNCFALLFSKKSNTESNPAELQNKPTSLRSS